MPTKRNRSIGEYTDYDANIRHYQDINNQIERKTIAVLETASKFGTESEKLHQHEESQNPRESYKKDRTNDALLSCEAGRSAGHKNQLLVDLNSQLKLTQNELESIILKNKRLEEEKMQQLEEINCLKDTTKRLKAVVHSKQLTQEAQKKEIGQMLEKIKAEDQFKRSLQKEVERLAKLSANLSLEKGKTEEKVERAKTDLILLKQKKQVEHSGHKFATMMQCIRKQAILIENLTRQISYLEIRNITHDDSITTHNN